MPRAILLRIARAPDRHLRLTVSDGETRPAESEIEAPSLSDLSLGLAGTGRILLAGRDAEWTRAEDALGRKLGALLARGTAAWAHLMVLRGRLEALGKPPVVLIDAEDPELRALPWELLSLGAAPLEGVEGGLVARLGAGKPPTARPAGTACVWAVGDDPTTQSLADDLRQKISNSGLSVVGVDGSPAMLWVVAHGERAATAVELASGGQGAGAVSAMLASALSSAVVVVLAVCHAGSPGVEPLLALSGRILASGTALVVTPVTSVPVDVVRRFAEGFLAQIARGEPLGAAVAGGRRAVRAWAYPHALARWNQLQCWVTSPSALSCALKSPSHVPPSWPSPDAEAAEWLAAAHKEARRRAEGYLGVEHLLRALMRIDGGGVVAAAVRRVAPRWLEPYDRSAAALVPQQAPLPGQGPPTSYGSAPSPPTPSGDDLLPTPRLTAFGESLQEGFGVDALALALGSLGPLVVGEVAVSETVDTVEEEGGPANALAILGGPEDGRILRPSPADVIGRAGGAAQIELYLHTRLTDRKVSRAHLRWEGEGMLFALARVHVRSRSSDQTSVTGPLPISVGDEIALSEGTRIIGLRL